MDNNIKYVDKNGDIKYVKTELTLDDISEKCPKLVFIREDGDIFAYEPIDKENADEQN